MIAVIAYVAQAATPSPTPAPTATPRISWDVRGANVVIDQATHGSGATPPEGNSFASGGVVAPMSPYDWFTSAPLTPGVAGVSQYTATGTLHGSKIDFSAKLGTSLVVGDVTNAAYWGEPLAAPLDPHRGSTILPYSVSFPTHAATNDAHVLGLFLLGASAGASNESWKVRGGYFDLAQTDRFVFAPPAITSVSPSLGIQTAESLGSGAPAIDAWNAAAATLPLEGVDVTAKIRGVSFELSDGLLPALTNTQARLTNASLVFDRGDYGRFSAQVIHVRTSGDPVGTTTLFGSNPTIEPSAQGDLPSSTLADQRQTIAGARAFFHPSAGYDALVELGRSWYDAGLVDRPGTSKPGNWEHFAAARHFNETDDVGIDYYRFEPHYATAILPYGVAENVWSVAWSWPGPWLKSTYQLVDSSIVGINRAGYRAHFDRTAKRYEVHLAYAGYKQIVPITFANATRTGFVEGFFLPQQDGFGTQGLQRQFAAYVAWHFDHDDIALDFVRDAQHRDATPQFPRDLVAMQVPQVVATWQHHFSKRALAVAGYGRYSASGDWATTPVLGIYSAGFLGAQAQLNDKSSLLLQVRRFALTGLPSIPGGPPPTLRGSSLVVEHQVRF